MMRRGGALPRALDWETDMALTDFRELHVVEEDEGRLIHLRFNHGKANECGRTQLEELERLVSYIEGAASVRGLVVTADKQTRSGKSMFIAGANVTERASWDDLTVFAHVRWQREILRRLSALPVFVVMVADGLALGLGTELMLCADWRIATPRASFALPETGLGIIPGARGSAELASIVGVAAALMMGMTGERIPGAQATELGLVNELVEDNAQGLSRAKDLIRKTFLKSPSALKAYKHVVKGGVGLQGDEREALEAAAYEGLVLKGEASIGRAHFKSIREGKAPPWGERS